MDHPTLSLLCMLAGAPLLVDVRFYSGLGGGYSGGFSMSENDLRRPKGYAGTEVV